MKNNGQYSVIVGNIGTVYTGDGTNARRHFSEYRAQSKNGIGRAAGENVTILHNNEIIKEFVGSLEAKEIVVDN